MKLVNCILWRKQGSLEEQSDFDYETRCVSALYERLLGPVETIDVFKLLVECLEDANEDEPRNLLGVMAIEQKFDFAEYYSAPGERRKHLALHALHSGAMRVARALGWPQEPFETARETALAMQLINRYEWPKKARWSPNRKYTAVLECVHEIDSFTAILAVHDKAGQAVSRETAFEVKPSDFHFVPKLGMLKWASNQLVVLIDRNGEAIARVAL